MLFLTARAFFGLLAFDVIRLGRHFSTMHKLVSRWAVAERMPPPTAVDRICEAVNLARVWYPKRVRCLQRSVVTTCLLRSLGVPAKMVLGVQKLPFKAHAWTEVDGRAINERTDVQKKYAVWERF